MEGQLSVLIPTDDECSHVSQAIDQVRASDRSADIVVVLQPSTSASVADRLIAACRASGVRVVRGEGHSPGAQRNAAITTARGDFIAFLQAGDTVDPQYFPDACRRLIAHPDVSCVTAWSHGPGSAGLETLHQPRMTLDAIMTDGDLVPGPTVFRRTTFEAVGCFDEDLPSSEWYDLWIRWMAGRFPCFVIDSALIGYLPSRRSAIRRDLDRAGYLEGRRRVFEKHRRLFQGHMTPTLCDRDSSLRSLHDYYQRLLRLRDGLVSERTGLLEEIELIAHERRMMQRSGFEWGELRRLVPLSSDTGVLGVTDVVGYFIQRFLESYAPDIRGTVLEVKTGHYAERFAAGRVSSCDVLDENVHNPAATVFGDLGRLDTVEANHYDCIIATGRLQSSVDPPAMIREALRVLKPGGVMLAAMPCAGTFRGRDAERTESSRLSETGWRRLLSEAVPSTHLATQSFGNLSSSIAMLAGLAPEQLSPEELEANDPNYPVVVGIRMVKPSAAPAVLSRRPQGSGAILQYHRVTEPLFDPHGLCVRPSDFRAHLTYLSQHCHLMPLVQLAAAIREGWLPERAVTITFDNGYLDNLLEASPVLLEHRCPATFFMTSAGLHGADPFWWDVLAAIFLGPHQIPTSVRLELGDAEESLATANAVERRHAHDRIYLQLRTAGAIERARLLDVLQQWSGLSVDLESHRAMNRNELADLARRPGHSIGGHGADHLWLSSHPRDVIQRDIRDNRLLLEGAIGRPVSCFAYPFGNHDSQTSDVLRDLDFAVAVTCENGGVRPGMDPLRLPRLVVGPADGGTLDDRLRSVFATVSEAQVQAVTPR